MEYIMSLVIKNKLPIVSVIVPTYNSERTLKKCFESIKYQDYKGKIEIIIIDNYSVDDTKKIAEKFEVKFIEEKSERSKARNTGVQLARGKYILYLDSDMYLSKSLIKECVNNFEMNVTKVALYIPEKILGNGFWIKVRNFERSFYNATCIDAVRFINLEIFNEINGFDENLVAGEDWDLDKRIKEKGNTDIIENCLYHDEGEFNIISYLKKKKMYVNTTDRYIKKWGKEDLIIKRQFSARYRFIDVFIENGKWRKIIKKPHFAFATFGLRCMVGICYFLSKLNSYKDLEKVRLGEK